MTRKTKTPLEREIEKQAKKKSREQEVRDYAAAILGDREGDPNPAYGPAERRAARAWAEYLGSSGPDIVLARIQEHERIFAPLRAAAEQAMHTSTEKGQHDG